MSQPLGKEKVVDDDTAEAFASDGKVTSELGLVSVPDFACFS